MPFFYFCKESLQSSPCFRWRLLAPQLCAGSSMTLRIQNGTWGHHNRTQMVTGRDPSSPKYQNFQTSKFFSILTIFVVIIMQVMLPGDNEGAFLFSSQAATCLPHSVEVSSCFYVAERPAGKL